MSLTWPEATLLMVIWLGIVLLLISVQGRKP